MKEIFKKFHLFFFLGIFLGVGVMAANTIFHDRVGIGTTTPQAMLDVAGGVKVADDATICSTTTKGAVRYNSSSNKFEGCDGSDWAAFYFLDDTVNSFSFTDQTGVNFSTLILSNILQISGINTSVSVSVSGDGTPNFRTCSDSSCNSVIQDWTTSGSIENGEFFQLRLTSSAQTGDQYTVTVSVSSASDSWNVTTSDLGCSGTGTQTFNYTGSEQTFSVPANIALCDFTITVDGAGGGHRYQDSGAGSGGRTSFDFAPGQAGTFYMIVGEGGNDTSVYDPVYGGGAGGDPGTGGGASAIKFDSTLLAISGGGGGAGEVGGGAGGCETAGHGGGAGSGGGSGCSECGRAYGGSNNVGGAGTDSNDGGSAGGDGYGTATRLGIGISGYLISGGGAGDGGDGGAGGGGYGGGGGGMDCGSNIGTGGGGGGSYVNNGVVTNVSGGAAQGSGPFTDGVITISW